MPSLPRLLVLYEYARPSFANARCYRLPPTHQPVPCYSLLKIRLKLRPSRPWFPPPYPASPPPAQPTLDSSFHLCSSDENNYVRLHLACDMMCCDHRQTLLDYRGTRQRTPCDSCVAILGRTRRRRMADAIRSPKHAEITAAAGCRWARWASSCMIIMMDRYRAGTPKLMTSVRAARAERIGWRHALHVLDPSTKLTAVQGPSAAVNYPNHTPPLHYAVRTYVCKQ